MPHFTTKLFSIGTSTILHLPKEVSKALPSRGMVMVKGSMNGFSFQQALEPDGYGSHWVGLDKALLKGAHAKAGDSVEVDLEPTKDWPEPNVPEKIQRALAADEKAHALWNQITPMARWDWIRWIRSTKNSDTYTHHITVALSKLKHGEKRPCCFNRSMCTDFSICRNGKLPTT